MENINELVQYPFFVQTCEKYMMKKHLNSQRRHTPLTFPDLQWFEMYINVLKWAKMSQQFLHVQHVGVVQREEMPSFLICSDNSIRIHLMISLTL